MLRAFCNQRLAHRNSVASMERPMGMTTNAGPGKTISAIPKRVTVPPITATTIRLATRRFGTYRSREFHPCRSCFIESVREGPFWALQSAHAGRPGVPPANDGERRRQADRRLPSVVQPWRAAARRSRSSHFTALLEQSHQGCSTCGWARGAQKMRCSDFCGLCFLHSHPINSDSSDGTRLQT